VEDMCYERRLFQCVTGDGWALAVTRPMFLKDGGAWEGKVCAFEFGVAFFRLSYIMVVMVVIVNIVLAVLLDAFLKAAEVGKQQDLLHEHASDLELVSQIAKLTKQIDPFLSCLAYFTTS
jgi:uncharacterized membrane protein